MPGSMGATWRVARSLARTPRLVLPAIACIGLGVGAAVLALSLVDGILVRAPALPAAERLARVWLRHDEHGGQGDVSYLELQELRGVRAFDAVEAVARTRVAWLTSGGSERLRGEAFTAGYFDLMGVRPLLGRLPSAVEQRRGSPLVVAIGFQLWQRRFAGRRDVLGATLLLRGSPVAAPPLAYTVVGVLPAGFVGSVDSDVAEVWMPLAQSPSRAAFDDPEARNVWVLARRWAGSSLAAAQAEVAAAARRLAAQRPRLYTGTTLVVEPFGESWRTPLRPGLRVLLASAALLLAIAAVNVALLLLARLAGRERELSLRRLLGATPARMVRELAMEVLLLSAAGGSLGSVLAFEALPALRTMADLRLPSYVRLQVDGRTLALALLVVGATATLAGVLPVLVGGRPDSAPLLARTGTGTTQLPHERRAGRALVVFEVAVTFVLAVGGTLLLDTYRHLATRELGFRSSHLARLAITLDPASYPTSEAVLAFAARARGVLRSQPGVLDVAVMSEVLPPWFDDRFTLAVPGTAQEVRDVPGHAVDSGFLSVMGMHLVAGRPFAAGDGPRGAPVALVSRSLARYLGVNPERALGRRLQRVVDGSSDERSPPFEVVGVVEDVLYNGPLASAASGFDLYLPFAQSPRRVVSLAVRTAGDPGVLLPSLQRRLGQLAPSSPVHWVSTMEEELRSQRGGARLAAVVIGSCASAATLLTLLGVYGVLSHAVGRRRGELAVRAAVGARRVDLVRMVMREGGRLLVVGLVLGTPAALRVRPALGGLLYGVAATAPWVYVAVATALVTFGLLACYLPARRAAAEAPLAALRRGE